MATKDGSQTTFFVLNLFENYFAMTNIIASSETDARETKTSLSCDVQWNFILDADWLSPSHYWVLATMEAVVSLNDENGDDVYLC